MGALNIVNLVNRRNGKEVVLFVNKTYRGKITKQKRGWYLWIPGHPYKTPTAWFSDKKTAFNLLMFCSQIDRLE